MNMPLRGSVQVTTGGNVASVAFGLITASSLVAALLLPGFSSEFESTGSFADGGWNTVTVTCAVVVAVLVLGSFGAARSSSAAGAVGGTCLAAATLCAVLGTAVGWGASGSGLDPAGGVVFLWFTVVSGTVGAAAAYGGVEKGATRPLVPRGLAIVGALAACLVTVGMVTPPPVSDLGYAVSFADWNVVFRGSDSGWATAVNVSVVAWKLSAAIAGIVGFTQRRRWGAWFVVAACVPLATVGFGDDQGQFSQLQNNFHPLFGVGLAATIVLGLIAALVASPQQVMTLHGATTNPAQWAPDPFGRHQMRYWNGGAWSEHVADSGTTGHDEPGWRTQPVVAVPAATPVMPAPTTSLAFPVPPLSSPIASSSSPFVPTPSPIAPLPSPVMPGDPPRVSHTETQPTRGVVALGGRQPAPSGPTGRVPTLVLPDGRRTRLDRVVVLGRDPSASGHSVPVSVDDTARSVSKTHAQIEHRIDGAIWVTDLHSTNGTRIVWPDGRNVAVAGGVSLEVELGAVVEIGDVRLVIERT